VAVTAGRFGSEDPEDPERPSRFKFSVLEQLEHVRKRIINSAIAVGVGVVVAFAVINPIVDFVFKPIRSVLPPDSKLIYTVPGEAFSVYVTIALIAGVVLASPFISTTLGPRKLQPTPRMPLPAKPGETDPVRG